MEGCPVVGVAGELAVVQHGHDLVADISLVLSIVDSIIHEGDPRGWRRDAVDLEHGLWLRRLLGWRGRRRGRGFCVSEFVPKLQVISHGGGGQGGRGAGQTGGGGGGGEVL